MTQPLSSDDWQRDWDNWFRENKTAVFAAVLMVVGEPPVMPAYIRWRSVAWEKLWMLVPDQFREHIYERKYLELRDGASRQLVNAFERWVDGRMLHVCKENSHDP